MLQVISITVLCVFTFCYAKPADLYDEIVENDEKQLLLSLAELMESIGADDSESDSGRSTTASNESSLSASTNELKDMKPGERCILPVRKGVCRALIPRWSYDSSKGDCKEFKFGGCDGNGNNFSSRKHCMEVCDGI